MALSTMRQKCESLLLIKQARSIGRFGIDSYLKFGHFSGFNKTVKLEKIESGKRCREDSIVKRIVVRASVHLKKGWQL